MRSKKKKSKNKSLSQGKLKNLVLRVLASNPKKRLNAKQIILKRKIGNSYASVREALLALEKEKLILEHKEGKYKINKEKWKERSNQKETKAKKDGRRPLKEYSGRVDQTRSGDGYIVVAELEDDIFVPSKYLNGAFHNDTVKVRLNPGRRRRPEGKVVSIIKRGVQKIIGRVEVFGNYGVIHNDKGRNPDDIYIALKHLKGAKDGDFVLAEITDWGASQNKGIWAKVKEVLAEHSASDMAMQSILLAQGFDAEFPDEVVDEVKNLPEEIVVTEDELKRRRDFRKDLCVTIDPDTAKDFDDAISLRKLDNGNWEVGVHIADVTHYVKPKTALDKEAFHRSTSVYLVDRVCPMLPEVLSNNLCSLMPKVDRFTFSVVFSLDENFEVEKRWFGKGIIHSKRRFTYEEAQQRLETGEGDFAEELRSLNMIASKLRKEKFKNGAISFESEEVKFRLDESGTPIGLYVKERKEAHMLVEDFMLLANREVAKFVAQKKGVEVPFVYRVHDQPDPDKLREFALFAKEMGVKMKIDTPKQISKSLNALLKRTTEEPNLKMLQPLAIRTMAKAIYTTENIGHYGLAFEHYGHFTSPIRRYADVLVHRILYDNLGEDKRWNKEKLESKCKHISLQEKKAAEAERDSIKYKQVEYLQKFVGDEFEGRVSGIIDRGLFIQLIESRAEGMISFSEMGDYFVIDENRLKAKSSKTGKVFKMGDELKVRLVKADLENVRIDLDIIQ